jgi:hypothetical protein
MGVPGLLDRFARFVRIDDITGFWVALGSWECACFDSQTGHINAYVLLEFQRINKQKAAKRNVDYFQRVCDAKLMHDKMRKKVSF